MACPLPSASAPALYVSDGYRVRLAPGVLAKALRLARVRAPLETGGLLLGAVVDGEAHVLAITGPGRRAVRGRVGFAADRVRDNRLLGRVSPCLRYLGDWHTHPGGPARLSRTDEASVRETLNAERPEVLHLLLSGPSAMQGHVVASVFTAVCGEAAIRRMEVVL
ncbi:Mov34/MPN/PAD-1 family protein [Corallococcus carmarthensis]|uniref:JAB domain-containing protein n=1 Tax=Corallococcus carmarthensis TaxID=2316728 RepID=A0A3A8KC27_9BACT|nr:Mov34/MPN/PAD-1 family protein [Corallococcus carmarthensis]RKH05086.1 hypothetical protein D7X32_09220 [Corallococcus carmarthensis]